MVPKMTESMQNREMKAAPGLPNVLLLSSAGSAGIGASQMNDVFLLFLF